MALSLEAPIEDLKLSKRVRNVLHLSGLHTLGSLLECDYKSALRRFGPSARAELACALETNGFTPPANLTPSEFDDLNEDLSKLYTQMAASFQKWSARLEHFETRIRELTTKGYDYHDHSCADTDAEEPGGAAAQEFGTRLSAVRAASANLQQVMTLPPEQQEVAAFVEQESCRLNLQAGQLLEMLHRETICQAGESHIPR